MRGVIPCLYTGLYSTSGPLLAAPPGRESPTEPSRAVQGAVESLQETNPPPTPPRRITNKIKIVSKEINGVLVIFNCCFLFKSWSRLYAGLCAGLCRTSLSTSLKNATVSYFCLYAVVPWVVRSPEIQLLSNLVLTNVSHFCLCWGLYEGCDSFFMIAFFSP